MSKNKVVTVQNNYGDDSELIIINGRIHLVGRESGEPSGDYILTSDVPRIVRSAVKAKPLAEKTAASYKEWSEVERAETEKLREIRNLKATLDKAEADRAQLTNSKDARYKQYRDDLKGLDAYDFDSKGGFRTEFCPTCITVGCKKFTYDQVPKLAARILIAARRKQVAAKRKSVKRK